MCSVCKDEQCHYGEYCYPEGVSVRLSLKPSDEMMAEARAALERMAADTRTEEQQIADAAAFVCDTRLGGP